MSSKIEEQAELFQDAFHEWLEDNGVDIGDFQPGTRKFRADVDLNLLKLAIMKLNVHQAEKQKENWEKEVRLKAELTVRGDYLFMMNTHAFGRPFSYEKVLQVTKDTYAELEADLAHLSSKEQKGSDSE